MNAATAAGFTIGYVQYTNANAGFQQCAKDDGRVRLKEDEVRHICVRKAQELQFENSMELLRCAGDT